MLRACGAVLRLLSPVVFVALSTGGCGGEFPRTPVSPGTSPPGAFLYMLSGNVTATNDEPLSGVTVSVIGTSRSAQTDASGAYLITGLQVAPGTVLTVNAGRAGYASATKQVVVEQPMSVDFVLGPEPGDSLSGTVTEMTTAGPVPLEGVHVENSNNHESVKTDKNGFYRLSEIEGHAVRLFVAKVGFLEIVGWEMVVRGDVKYDIQLVRR